MDIGRAAKIATKIRCCILMGALLVIAGANNLVSGQKVEPDDDLVVSNNFRPIEVAASFLQIEYTKPVTYEDPILLWAGDVEPQQNLSGEIYFRETRRSFIIPNEAKPDKTPGLDESLLRKVLNAYHMQTDGPRFKVSVSRWGLHIIPAEVRDATGKFINAQPLLDTMITIPTALRTPEGHLAAFCEAVTAVNTMGITLKPNLMWMNQYFSEKPLPLFLTPDQKAEISFEWGATNTSARDAAISLLEKSSSTMSWAMLCEPGKGYCVFNLSPIMVKVRNADGIVGGWKALQHDRKR